MTKMGINDGDKGKMWMREMCLDEKDVCE